MEKNPNQNTEQKEQSFVRPLRTYKDDVANLVKDNKLSTSKIVLAEQKRRQRNPEEYAQNNPDEKGGKKKVFKFIAAIILFTLGGGVIWSIFTFGLIPESIKKVTTDFQQENEILRVEDIVEISTKNRTDQEMKKLLVNEISKIQSDTLDQVIELRILKEQISEEGQTSEIDINSQEFFGILNSNANDKLIRSLKSDFLYGVYKEVEPAPFIILKTSDINITFAEIFKWEGIMYKDLKEFLNLKSEVPDFITETVLDNEEDPTSTSTKTVLIENTEPQFSPSNFTDIVISNRDARVIADEEGGVILIYSFIDDETILFTKNIEAFKQLIQRISTQKLLR